MTSEVGRTGLLENFKSSDARAHEALHELALEQKEGK
jgi:hypothetical protein